MEHSTRELLEEQRKLQAPHLQLIIREKDLPAFTGLKRCTIENLILAGTFPKPIRLSERAKGWLSSEIEKWQAERIAARDAAVSE